MVQKTSNLPLVVDLDGTLTATDTLAESIIGVIRHNPINLLRLPFWLIGGRAAFKARIAARMDFRADSLPYREALLDYLKTEKDAGRKIVLATAAHRSIAQRVSAHLGLFDAVIATENTNLKGAAKLARIRAEIGEQFVYAGDSRADLPIWAAAQGAILVSVAPNVASIVRATTPVEREFPAGHSRAAVWPRALRIHQWLKNLLLFVPLLTAFAFFDTRKLLTLALAFAAMSLGASATYIANDLWNLDHDRHHPRKRLRPFASGALPIAKGVAVATVFLAISLVLAYLTARAFLAVFLLYLMLTTIYSWYLKSRALLNVIVLSMLCAVAVDITLSRWLIAFSVFTFLSLALVKRCAELVSLRESGNAPSADRDYQISDLEILWPFGVSASLAAVVVFGLFVNAPETLVHYALPQLLWLVQIGLIYLFARLWIITHRGAMHDDPVIWLMKDRGSLGVIAIMLALMLSAHFIHISRIFQ